MGRRVRGYLVLFAELYGQERGQSVEYIQSGTLCQYGQTGPADWKIHQTRRWKDRQTEGLEAAKNRCGDQETARSGGMASVSELGGRREELDGIVDEKREALWRKREVRDRRTIQ